MDRRSFLRTAVGTGPLGGVATASAHPDGSDSNTPGSETPTGTAPLGSIDVDGAKEAVVRDGTTVFLATTDGFAVVDVTQPAEPTVSYRTDAVLDDHDSGPLRGIWDVKADGDRLLVVGPAHGGSDAVYAAVVYDVSDPRPERVTVHETEYPIHNGFLDDGVAYLTGNNFETNPLVTVDATSGEELGRWSLVDDEDDGWTDVEPLLRAIHDVWVHDGVAYVAHWDAGTWILDVADPATPTVLARARGRSAEDLAQVEQVSREGTELPGNDHFVTVDESGSVLGIGVEAWAAESSSDSGPGGIHLYDVSDPAAPQALSHIHPPPTSAPTRDGVWTTAHNFELVDDRLYSSWYQGGVKVHDLADPAEPREQFHWRDADRAKFWTAQRGVPGEFFVASSWERPEEDGPGGLFTFPDPSWRTPTPASDTPTESGGGGTGVGTLLGVGALAAGGLGALGFSAWRARR